MFCLSVNHPRLKHLPASDRGTCRLWDPYLPEDEQREDGRVRRVKFSEDGSLLAVRQLWALEMWKTSTRERLWSVPCKGLDTEFSDDGLRVLVQDRETIHAYDVQSGDTLGKISSMPKSTHDHVHMFQGEVGDKWECAKCESSLFERGEYWFTDSDRWLWVVEERTLKRLTHIAEYPIHDVKGYSTYVAIGCNSGFLLLDTGRNLEAV